MSTTQIEWTDATWNPVAGCSLASAGCTNCYAMHMARRLEAMGVAKYKGLTLKSGRRIAWKGNIREDAKALETPYRWRKPRKVFVNSMSDLFHEDVNEAFIDKVWQVMSETPRHQYQVLTKRPAAMREFVEGRREKPLPNVWLGTSVEDDRVVDRIEELRRTPAVIRFISFEPLIGPVGEIDLSDIHWSIVGGESGHRARLIRESWIDEIYEQCQRDGSTFFFKQWGAWGKDNKKRSKKANGREYRGRTWDDMPRIVEHAEERVGL
ncbi:MAG: phage Gp37/Gp68 family protein [Pseudomonadota bacterium]